MFKTPSAVIAKFVLSQDGLKTLPTSHLRELLHRNYRISEIFLSATGNYYKVLYEEKIGKSSGTKIVGDCQYFSNIVRLAAIPEKLKSSFVREAGKIESRNHPGGSVLSSSEDTKGEDKSKKTGGGLAQENSGTSSVTDTRGDSTIPRSGVAAPAASMADTGGQPQSYPVEHDQEKKLFYVKLGNEIGVLEYSEIKGGVLDLYHTEIPVKLRGRRIGESLATAAFNYVVENNLRMKLTCTYLQHFYTRHGNSTYEARIYRE